VELINQADIDGALVGGASLKSDSFAAIVKGCLSMK
ncbi:MAG: triose-phosphate isomerase, partial [Candidatus Omnitrophica bacterium]|nr:triose-phosphate isomerase [Candidatus Omnitrophota bacterium]